MPYKLEVDAFAPATVYTEHGANRRRLSGYPTDVEFIKGNLPFCFGSVYAYAKITEKSIAKACIGYWQFS
ncbi:MAG: hypothetical protein FWG53_08070 [Clostridiales bacterium]|nr:hypothetical protein [Clostridiales bacterium]